MKKLLITTISTWFIAASFLAHAQHEKAGVPYIESIEAHINTDFLITGETLFFSIYCLDASKNKTSPLSKLAYVELVGEDEKPLLQAKISLSDGRGAGDFFLPSTLPSGNYTFIAYTKWMRNFPLENFFQRQITIINPYLKPLSAETKGNDKTIVSSTLSNRKNEKETTLVTFTSDKKHYSQRQKVTFVIKNNDPLSDCNISINVHRSDKTNKPSSVIPKSDSMAGMNGGSPEIRNEFISLLPDLRGETIGGIIKESVSHQPVVNTTIYLSAPGTSSVFQISKTDSAGRFYFSTKNIQTQTGIRFQVDQQSETVPVEIILDSEFVNDYKKFRPQPLSIDTSLWKQIEQRNIYSQIENAYFSKKADSVVASNQEPFFNKPDKVYKLDDFTRFPTMEDIFREYVYEVAVSKRNGKFSLQLINARNGFRFLNTPLMLLDGIQVSDTETIMNYNPLLIKQISVINRQYIYAGILFDGILSINTYEGNAKELPVANIQKEYTSWQLPKKYYSPIYNDNKSLDRIPDYRLQLFWNPTIRIESGKEFTGEFYTSDIEGEFIIEVKGFNSNGEPVNISQIIEVRK